MAVLFLGAGFFQEARAGKILLVAADSGIRKAKEVEYFLRRVPPFSRAEELEIEIRKVPRNFVKCTTGLPDDVKIPEKYKHLYPKSCHKADKVPTRLVSCDHGPILKLMAETGSDRVLFVRPAKIYGGSGQGQVAVITEGTPPEIGLHELLHTFGLADEYPYDECSAPTYCQIYGPPTAINFAYFEDHSPYAGDSAARARHTQDIPWFMKIHPSTPITSGSSLGTPQADRIGLHPSLTCSEVYKPGRLRGWKPGRRETIMGPKGTTHIPEVYWDNILDGLNTRLRIETAQKPTEHPEEGFQ